MIERVTDELLDHQSRHDDRCLNIKVDGQQAGGAHLHHREQLFLLGEHVALLHDGLDLSGARVVHRLDVRTEMTLNLGVDPQLAGPAVVVAGQDVDGLDLVVPLGVGLEVGDDAEDVRGPGIDLDGLAHQWHQTCTFPTGMAGPACPSGDFTRVFASRISPRNNAVLNSAAISWAVRRPSGRSQR